MKNIKNLLFSLLILVVFFSACGKKEANETAVTMEPATATTDVASETKAPETPTSEAPAPEVELADVVEEKAPLPDYFVVPLTDNTTGKTMIQVTAFSKQYPFNSYMITSLSGTKVILDQAATLMKEMYDLKPDLIASTHDHSDHYNPIFLKQYSDVPQILFTVEDFKVKDIRVYTIPSSHFDDNIDLEPFSNVFVVTEVDGLRIVHMGDCGQSELTEEQLVQLGEIDIAFMQFDNSFSSMSNGNGKGYHVIDQVNPKIIIPTHYNKTSVEMLTEKYGEIEHFDNLFTVSKEELPDSTKVVIIDNSLTYEKK